MWSTFKEIEALKSVTKLCSDQKMDKNYHFYWYFLIYCVFFKYLSNSGKKVKLKFHIQEK